MSNSSISLLKKHGYKITPARLAVLEVFTHTSKPLNADHISKHQALKGIDPVTIYRTLNTFEKNQIIKRIELRKDSTYYELESQHHHHIICRECGIIEDFEVCNIEKITKEVLQHSHAFTAVTDHSFELFGFCKKCISPQNLLKQ